MRQISACWGDPAAGCCWGKTGGRLLGGVVRELLIHVLCMVLMVVHVFYVVLKVILGFATFELFFVCFVMLGLTIFLLNSCVLG